MSDYPSDPGDRDDPTPETICPGAFADPAPAAGDGPEASPARDGREPEKGVAGVQHSRARRTVARLVGALWFGSAAFLLAVAAPAAFRASDTPTNAANVVGSMLTTWHYLGLALPLVLLALEWKRARAGMIAVVFAAIMFASTAALIDLRIRAIRAGSPVPISALDRSDPVRRHFGMLHGISSLLLLAQIVAAGAAVAIDTER